MCSLFFFFFSQGVENKSNVSSHAPIYDKLRNWKLKYNKNDSAPDNSIYLPVLKTGKNSDWNVK